MTTTTLIQACVFTPDDGRPRHYSTNPDLTTLLKAAGADVAAGDRTAAAHILVSVNVDGEAYDVVQVDSLDRPGVDAIRQAISALQVVEAGMVAAGATA